MNEQVEERELSQEELAARKEEMLRFYQESMPYLQAQCDYEELLARIDEARFKRAEAQIKFAMMMQGPPKDNGSDDDIDEATQTKERKLKKN